MPVRLEDAPNGHGFAALWVEFPQPPRNEKKRFRIRLALDTEPLFFVPRPSRAPLSAPGNPRTTQNKYNGRWLKNTFRPFKPAGKKPFDALSPLEMKPQGRAAGKLPAGCDPPHRRSHDPPRLQKSLKRKGGGLEGGRGNFLERFRFPLQYSVFSLPYPSGAFGRIVQMPQGHTPAQTPQPMQRSGSDTYRNEPSGRASRRIACSGQDS